MTLSTFRPSKKVMISYIFFFESAKILLSYHLFKEKRRAQPRTRNAYRPREQAPNRPQQKEKQRRKKLTT
jgi:hypothetical protein